MGAILQWMQRRSRHRLDFHLLTIDKSPALRMPLAIAITAYTSPQIPMRRPRAPRLAIVVAAYTSPAHNAVKRRTAQVRRFGLSGGLERGDLACWTARQYSARTNFRQASIERSTLPVSVQKAMRKWVGTPNVSPGTRIRSCLAALRQNAAASGSSAAGNM